MDFTFTQHLESRHKADLIVVPFWKGSKHPEAASELSSKRLSVSEILESGDFLGKEGEIALAYLHGQPEKRVALLGLGSKQEINVEKLRRAYAAVTKLCKQKKLSDVNIILPQCVSVEREDLVRGVSEGLLLPNYAFTSLKHDSLKDEAPVLLAKATFVGGTKTDASIANKYATLADSVNFVRDLVNGNADDVTPQHLAAVARGLEKGSRKVKTTVFDKARIVKEKMGLLLAVNRGSSLDPAFIIVEYKGNPKSSDRTVIVGKGITFDTGGLLVKPRGGMETMKDDMAGAAAALGVIHAASALDLKANIIAVVPSTENSIGSKSYKPGDVYKSYSGKTVEIIDTDAEGRLVLADALSYAVKNLKPTRMIDMATLTGSAVVALGEEATALMTNNDVLADMFAASGSETGERVWRLPLYEEYKNDMKSDIADLKNAGGRSGGAIKAGIFLQEFVGKTPWVHLDIAGTAFLTEARRYHSKYATGVGVRLLISLIEHL